YYAVATGFHGEIVLWMSVASLALLVIGGLVVDMFWCRYICPLGALSNTLKYWIWVVAVAGVWVALRYFGVDVPWWWQFAVVCAGGYVLEITRKPRFQLLSICKNSEKCISCGKCDKACPYHIQVANAPAGPVRSVDCTLCGECVASCSAGALAAGAACSRHSHDSSTLRFVLPALIAIILPLAGYFAGRNVELPTINETWGMESVDSAGNVTKLVDPSALTTVKLEGLRSVKCFGSSMAFKAKLEKIRGVYGVKTYVGSHSAVVTYDPTVLTEETLQEKIFTPSCFRVNSLDPQALDSLKIYTIRTEHMTDKVDLNYFGLQLRTTSRGIYGVESEFACPLIVRVFVDPSEELDSDWFKEVVERKVLAMPIHGGGVKETPVNWKYAGMEDEISYISTPDYLHKMFSPFKAQFKSRLEQFAEAPQMMYEIVDANYEKPIILRNMSFVSNHLSSHDGIIGIYLDLNPELKPAIMVRYSAPMTADKVWELLNMETWTIVYSADDVREVPAKLKFGTPGT
ncbi:MAG: hypothetical protein HUJ91_01685, partial [Bacteroidales bacterium]|nr:hypothetical protein [Bacteroidales bacterium]